MATSVTIHDLPALKKAQKKAIQDGKKSFMYKGQEVLVSYAKYLIEYLESLKKY